MGQTLRDVKQRIAEQLKTAAIKNYTIELDESAERDDGTIFTVDAPSRVHPMKKAAFLPTSGDFAVGSI